MVGARDGNFDVLISERPMRAMTPEAFHRMVKGFYALRETKGKAEAPAPGLAFSRTKKGALSLRYTKTKRAFRYVLEEEIEKILTHYEVKREELMEAFKKREFIITKTRIEAERLLVRKRAEK